MIGCFVHGPKNQQCIRTVGTEALLAGVLSYKVPLAAILFPTKLRIILMVKRGAKILHLVCV